MRGATIYKVAMNIADMNRHYYQQHELTVAQHPSESDFRLMIRLIAFAVNASESLTFTKGINAEDEPELWQKSLADEVELWVDFGQVEEKRIGKACGRSKAVHIYTYNDRKSSVWWKQNQQKLSRYKNLSVFHINAEGSEALLNRKMDLQCNIDDGEILITDESNSVNITVNRLEFEQ